MSTYENISIIAGGYSASRFSLDKLPGYVIGVNDAAIHSRCDVCVSMDRLWVENRWSRLCRLGIPAWLRRASLINMPRPLPPWVTVFECDYKSSKMVDDNPEVLNGTNSGLVAVNLAFQLRPACLRLYGMDGSRGPAGQAHWYPDYSWSKKPTSPSTHKLWSRDLHAALKQCRDIGIDTRIM